MKNEDQKKLELKMREQAIAGLARQFLISSFASELNGADIGYCFARAEEFFDHQELRMQSLSEQLDREVDG